VPGNVTNFVFLPMTPVNLPAPQSIRVFGFPGFFNGIKGSQPGLFIRSCMNRFQIVREGFSIFVADIFKGISYLVNDAPLNMRFRKHAMNCCIKAV